MTIHRIAPGSDLFGPRKRVQRTIFDVQPESPEGKILEQGEAVREQRAIDSVTFGPKPAGIIAEGGKRSL